MTSLHDQHLKIGHYQFEPMRPLRHGDLGLSLRELEVLTFMAQGLSTKSIARRLNLSSHTVNSYMRRIYQKLGVNSSTAAVAIAMAFRGGMRLSSATSETDFSTRKAA